MIRLGRRRPERPPAYPGIELRISTRDGVVVEADSASLYYSAKFGGIPGEWFALIGGGRGGGELGELGMPTPAGEYSVVGLKIEIRPVMIGHGPDA